MRRTHHTSAILFLLILIVGAGLTLRHLVPDPPVVKGFTLPQRNLSATVPSRTAPDIQVELPTPTLADHATALSAFLTKKATTAEGTLNDGLDADHWFIQLFGSVQSLLGRRTVPDVDPHYQVYRLQDGSLTFANTNPADATGFIPAVLRLQDILDDRDIPFLYLQSPQKVEADDDRLPVGVVDYSNDYADQFLTALDEEGIDYLDFRTVLHEQDAPWGSWFFDTDHHWTAQAAFLANQALIEKLTADYGFTFPSYATDPAYFHIQQYQDCLLGSQGRRVGISYSGLDDLVIPTPSFSTNFTYQPYSGYTREGTWDNSLLFWEEYNFDDPWTSRGYDVFAGGDYAFGIIENHNNPNGPRILLLRDSFASALTPYLALQCSTLIVADPRSFNDNLTPYLKWYYPDMVLMQYTPGALINDDMFDLFGRTTNTTYKKEPPHVTLERP